MRATLVVCAVLVLAFGIVHAQENVHELNLRTGTVQISLHPERHSNHITKLSLLNSVDHQEAKQYVVHVDLNSVQTGDISARLEQASGSRVLHYLPTDNFLMMLNGEQLQRLAQLREVLSVLEFKPEYKIDPELTAAHLFTVSPRVQTARERLVAFADKPIQTLESDYLHPGSRVQGMRKIQATLLPGAVGATHVAELVKDWQNAWSARFERQPKDLVIYAATPNIVKLMVGEDAMPAALEFLSSLSSVHWIEATPENRMLNDETSPIVQTGVTTRNTGDLKIWEKNIKGAGEIIGVGDSGLDATNCLFRDPAVALSSTVCAACQFTDYYDTNGNVKSTACSFPATGPCSQVSSHRKIASYWAFSDNQDNFAGHGSHVCGTVAGDSATLSAFSGMAPSAKIAFADLNNEARDGENSIATPPDLENNYLPFSYYLGARINTNSWGGGNSYGADSLQVDKFVFYHKDMVVLFAAGNDGPSSSSIGTQAQNKNGIAVGASRTSAVHAAVNGVAAQAQANENWRLLMNLNLFCTSTFYSRVPQGASQTVFQYLSTNVSPGFASASEAQTYYCPEVQKEPKDGFCCASTAGTPQTRNGRARSMLFNLFDFSCCGTDLGFATASSGTTAWDIAQVEGFSSRGPTSDQRIKPDIVAPGSVIVSAFAVDATTAPARCGTDPSRSDYALTSKQGTSMATPAVAGATALVREYFRRGFGACGQADTTYSNSNMFISAALVKAMLIHSGVTPLKNNNGATLTTASLTNAYATGYGRVQLSNVLRFTGDTFNLTYLDVSPATGRSADRVAQGATASFSITVPSNLRPLVVTLVWTDPPGSLSSASQLVNDLDLTVTSPTGTVTLGNSRFYASRDTRNNVEQVIIGSPASGTYTVSVRGTRVVVNSPQDYALVATFAATTAFAPAQNPACAAGPPAVNGPTVAAAPKITSNGNNDQFTVEVVTTTAARLYYVAVLGTASAPATSADVKNGRDGSGTQVPSNQRGSVLPTSCTTTCTFTFTLTGLDSKKQWTVAFAAETAANELQVFPGAVNYGYSEDSKKSSGLNGGGVAGIIVALVIVAIVVAAVVIYARRKPQSGIGQWYARTFTRTGGSGAAAPSNPPPTGNPSAAPYYPAPPAAYPGAAAGGYPGQAQPGYAPPQPPAYPGAYGQPAYGQPAYGQPAYGQPAYGQPAYGQPAYGQPAYGYPAQPAPAYGYPQQGYPAQPYPTQPEGAPSS